MSERQIEFAPKLESGNASVAGAQQEAWNVLVDGRGAIRRRPAIVAFSEAPGSSLDGSAVTGLFAHDSTLYATTESQNIFAVAGGSSLNLSTSGGATQLAGTSRPTFALWREPWIIIASGQEVQKVIPATNLSARLGGSPPIASQVVSMSQRLIVNEGTSAQTAGAFRYSDAGYPEVWDALRRADTESDPDSIVAMRSNMNELFAFCKRSVQVFLPDPNTIWSPSRARRLGCLASSSVVEYDEQFVWLDNLRRFVLSDGRAFQDISGGISGTLDSIATVSDAFGYRVSEGQFDCVAQTFPSDGRTFVWQPNSGWSQWSKWIDGVGHSRFQVNAHCLWDERNANVVGLVDGRVCKLESGTNTDIDGTKIKAEVVTGHDNRGTAATKTCRRVTLELVRGEATSGVVRLSWRDGSGAWSGPIERSLGGDYYNYVHFDSLGTYRQRQWKLEMTDAADFTLARATEDFTVAGN
jgi:hypothetical protein